MESIRRSVLLGSATSPRMIRNRLPNRSRRPLLPVACFLLSLFILAGCGAQESFKVYGTPRPLSCDIFAEFPWQKLNFGVASPADFTTIAINSGASEQDQFKFANLYGDDLLLEWQGSHSQRQVIYSVLFNVERRLESVDVTWNPPATITQVLDCLGAPRLYSAYYSSGHHEAVLNLELWYPDKGLSFHQDFYTRTAPFHPVEPAFRIDGFRVTAPTPPGQAAPGFYADGLGPLATALALCQVRPWPGSVEAIEAWTYLDDPRCR